MKVSRKFDNKQFTVHDINKNGESANFLIYHNLSFQWVRSDRFKPYENVLKKIWNRVFNKE